MLRQGGELLVLQLNLPGQADPDAVLKREVECARGSADGAACRRAGGERSKVQLGLHQDEASCVARAGGMLRDERPPGEEGGLSLRHALEGIGELGQGSLELGERGLALPHALECQLEGAHDAAQARIRGERTEEALASDELVHRGLHVRHGQEEEAVAGEELAAIGALDRVERSGFSPRAVPRAGRHPIRRAPAWHRPPPPRSFRSAGETPGRR